MMAERKILLQGIVGSTAYGLARPGSDIDQLGVFQIPTEEALGFDGPRKMDNSLVTTKPDVTMHELWKFMKLAMGGNPTVTEVLWLDGYETISDAGQLLVDNRELFLSQVYRKTYGGYAMQQLKRLKDRGDFSSDLKKRTEKHGRHCYRLIVQGMYALREGTVKVRLDEDEAASCFEAGELAVSDVDAYERMVLELMEKFDAIESPLPQTPHKPLISRLLVDIREDY